MENFPKRLLTRADRVITQLSSCLNIFSNWISIYPWCQYGDISFKWWGNFNENATEKMWRLLSTDDHTAGTPHTRLGQLTPIKFKYIHTCTNTYMILRRGRNVTWTLAPLKHVWECARRGESKIEKENGEGEEDSRKEETWLHVSNTDRIQQNRRKGRDNIKCSTYTWSRSVLNYRFQNQQVIYSESFLLHLCELGRICELNPGDLTSSWQFSLEIILLANWPWTRPVAGWPWTANLPVLCSPMLGLWVS